MNVGISNGSTYASRFVNGVKEGEQKLCANSALKIYHIEEPLADKKVSWG
jgi:hypothetical protein